MSDSRLWVNRNPEDKTEVKDTKSIFTGKPEDKKEVSDIITPDEKQIISEVSDDSPSPINSKSFKDLLGTKYESIVEQKQISDKFDISSMVHLSRMGFSSFAKGLMSSNGVISKISNSLQSGFKGGKISFSDYEKYISDPAKNLSFNSNPQGFPSISLLFGQDVDDKTFLNELNSYRRMAYDLSNMWDKIRETVVKDIIELDIENIKILDFVKSFDDALFSEDVISSSSNTYQEIVEFSDFLRNFSLEMERYSLRERTDSLDESIDSITNLANDYIRLVKDGNILKTNSENLSEYIGSDFKNLVNLTSFSLGGGSSCSGFVEGFEGVERISNSDGHSSVSRSATTFSNKEPSLRDIQTNNTNEAVDINKEPAKPKEKIKIEDSGDVKVGNNSKPSGKGNSGIGPLSSSDFNRYKQILGKRESGNNYSVKERRYGNYLGRWQFGAGALADTGFVKRGTSNRGTRKNSTWTGKMGVNGRRDWLNNKNGCQDVAMVAFNKNYYRAMLRNGAIKRGSSKRHVAGMLAAAHISGPGGAKKLMRGRSVKDGNGTSQKSYYDMMSPIR